MKTGLCIRRLAGSARWHSCIWTALFVGFLVASATGDPRFGLDNVSEMAKNLAAEPFKAPPSAPDFLRQLTYDEYRDIRFDPAQSLWKDGGNFRVELIHPGLYYEFPVMINVHDSTGVRRVRFSPKLFTYGKNKFADKIPADLGFAGFRLTYPFYKKEEYNHVIVFAGASYFRAVAKNEVFGLSGRGLAIDTGLASGEEFPYFKEFWLDKPARDAREIKVLALLDSQSLTGAYEFIVRPGESTVVDVRARLYERKKVNELGIAPLTSMFFHGEEKPRPARDWRPEVHDSDGLLVRSNMDEWVWRPLGNPEKLRVSYFPLENPRGFGLLQRDRKFNSYEDLEARYELRPNAWITPVGNWGKGYIKLVEIPSQKETNDNVVAYWIPKNGAVAGQPFEVAYRIHFQSEDPLDASTARVTAMRVGSGDKEDWKRIVVDFEGTKIKSLPAATPVKAAIGVGQDGQLGQLGQQNVIKNSVTGGWRLSFQVKPPKDKPLELRAALQNGNDTLSETWSYQLEP
jgi:periplasmic glucans biosynthesis protein